MESNLVTLHVLKHSTNTVDWLINSLIYWLIGDYQVVVFNNYTGPCVAEWWTVKSCNNKVNVYWVDFLNLHDLVFAVPYRSITKNNKAITHFELDYWKPRPPLLLLLLQTEIPRFYCRRHMEIRVLPESRALPWLAPRLGPEAKRIEPQTKTFALASLEHAITGLL